MPKIFAGRMILEVTDLQTVSDINELDIKLYEADPMLSGGWTRIFTYQNTVGYMDEIERLCSLSENKASKLLFRAYGPDLYYAKIRVTRKVCKDCRNKVYKNKEPGNWTEDNLSLPAAWFPKGLINPIRPNYGNMATVYCPAPVVQAWVHDNLVPKIYNILINLNEFAFSTAEFDMLLRGKKNHHARREHQKVRSGGHNVNTKQYKKTFVAKMDSAVCNRIGITVDDTDHAGRECIQPPPIWCPYKEKHVGV